MVSKIEVPLVIYDEGETSLDRWVAMYGRHLGKIARRISVRVRWRTIRATEQNWRCCWCGGHMLVERDRPRSCTLEHVTPLSKGGPDSFDNTAAACQVCNNRRGNKPASEYIELGGRDARSVVQPGQTGLVTIAHLRRAHGMSDPATVASLARSSSLSKAAESYIAKRAVLVMPINPFSPETRGWRIYEQVAARKVDRSG